MSKWRLRGYVQDSDEEDDLDTVSTSSTSRSQNTSDGRVAAITSSASRNENDDSPHTFDTDAGSQQDGAPQSSILGEQFAQLPPPPVTAEKALLHNRNRSESPDPLQEYPPTPRPETRSLRLPTPEKTRNPLHIDLYISTDTDSSLSEPPSDDELEAVHERPAVFASPQRRTQVRVVVPHTNVNTQQRNAGSLSRRQFRTRTAIQMHPYLLEGERYRREWQGRGLQPIARPKSPARNTLNNENETQEQEFNLNSDSSAGTPPSRTNTPERYLRRRDSSDVDRLPTSVSRPSIRSNAMSDNLHSRGAPGISYSNKRRKIARTSTLPLTAGRTGIQRSSPSASAHNSLLDHSDVFAVPCSPMSSSSAIMQGSDKTHPRSIASATNVTAPSSPLPPKHTPTTRRPLVLSDSEPDVPYSKVSERFRPIPLVTDSSSSDAAADSEQSEEEVRVVKKRIKGVLPASWLRLDQAAQKSRGLFSSQRQKPNSHAGTRDSVNGVGVARLVQRHTSRPRDAASGDTQQPIVVSGDSENEPVEQAPYVLGRNEDTGPEASAIAAAFDYRYAEGDSDQMEEDRLHLFTLGGSSRRAGSKRQSKLTDTLRPYKKAKAVVDPSGNNRGSSTKRPRPRKLTKHEQRRPPALSIYDFAATSQSKEDTPQFLKIALRQVQSLDDRGRHSPRQKYIRLATHHDTEEANATLNDWRRGSLMPRRSPKRRVLSERSSNQSSAPPRSSKGPILLQRPLPEQSASTSAPDENNRPASMGLLTSTAPPVELKDRNSPKESREPSAKARRLRHTIKGKGPYMRTAQLEGLATKQRTGLRKSIFERIAKPDGHGLLPSGSSWTLPVNPLLERFLAEDDDPMQVPLVIDDPSSAKPDHEDVAPYQPSGRPEDVQLGRRRRLLRKHQAKRINADSREYRQPSEPLAVDIIPNNRASSSEPEAHLTLEGLGPFGASFPITFDVTPFPSDIYFHVSTFVGGSELHRALQTGQRDLDTSSGKHTICWGASKIDCGPWNDELYAQISCLFSKTWAQPGTQLGTQGDKPASIMDMVAALTKGSRSLINYFSNKVHFLDSIDRIGFVAKMSHLLDDQLNRVSNLVDDQAQRPDGSLRIIHQNLRLSSYLLVLCLQTRQIASDSCVGHEARTNLDRNVLQTGKFIIRHLLSSAMVDLAGFLERYKSFQERASGIQEHDLLVETVIICLHALKLANLPGCSFWDLVSQELAPQAATKSDVKALDSIWAKAFSLLPFTMVDSTGIPITKPGNSQYPGNWGFIKELLRRAFSLYPNTAKTKASSLNEYIRALLRRCHFLIKKWHWTGCEPMLSVAFDFFGGRGLRQLYKEEGRGSPHYLSSPSEASLDVEVNDCAFHIFLKCLALGLQKMDNMYPEKKMRSIVLRCTPNHDRRHPKDQGLDQSSLDALRNHHDLLCTLYRAAPPSCRPKLAMFRNLIHHEDSHKEASRASIRACMNLTIFQLSVDEPYAPLELLANWHRDTVKEISKQYRLAKNEADDYIKDARRDGTSDISVQLVRTTQAKNQEQVIAVLQECVWSITQIVERASQSRHLGQFLADTCITGLFELPYLDDSRLSAVLRDTLSLLRKYASTRPAPIRKDDTQTTSEESQDYGDFPDLTDVEDLLPDNMNIQEQRPDASAFDFVQKPLWHLLSNAFGADRPPDDSLLMDCVDTWALIAYSQVRLSERSWSFFVHGSMSWQQLLSTEQTRKFKPYFFAAILSHDSLVYTEHPSEMFHALFGSLVEREAMLRFQHKMLRALLSVDPSHPLLKNIPFRNEAGTRETDITAETLRERRVALLSSLLANMRDDLYATIVDEPVLVQERMADHAQLLEHMMAMMRNNYIQLKQGSSAKGAYVEFVQTVVHLLKQYTSDICAVDPFFTNSVDFPLPANDPTYIVGRLCGYSPKLNQPGVAKQLSWFIQTVTRQAAAKNQQEYLLYQLRAALVDSRGSGVDRSLLREVLLQGIFPAYIEVAFTGLTGACLARPILHALKPMLEALIFDIRITDEANIQRTCRTIWSIHSSLIQGCYRLLEQPSRLEASSFMQSVALLFQIAHALLPSLDFIIGRTATASSRPIAVAFFVEAGAWVVNMLHGTAAAEDFPALDAGSHPIDYCELLEYCRKELHRSIESNCSEDGDRIIFGRGNAASVVTIDVNLVEEEKANVMEVIGQYIDAVESLYGKDKAWNGQGAFLQDVLV